MKSSPWQQSHRLAPLLLLACIWTINGCVAPSMSSNSTNLIAESAQPPPYVQTIEGSDVKFPMASIPGGLFVMGSPLQETARREDEGPRHRVLIEPFWMGAHEVTWNEYKLFMREYTLSRERRLSDSVWFVL